MDVFYASPWQCEKLFCSACFDQRIQVQRVNNLKKEQLTTLLKHVSYLSVAVRGESVNYCSAYLTKYNGGENS